MNVRDVFSCTCDEDCETDFCHGTTSLARNLIYEPKHETRSHTPR